MTALADTPTILIAEDDPEEQLMIGEAFRKNHLNRLYFVSNGEQLIDYLNRRGEYEKKDLSPRPDLILLDLNMPRQAGHQVLQKIKADPNHWAIPVIVWASSNEETDIRRCYNLGAASYITKPKTFDEIIEGIRDLGRYLRMVKFPPREDHPVPRPGQ